MRFGVHLLDFVEQFAGGARFAQLEVGDQAVEQRYEEHREEGCREHAADDPGADRRPCSGAGAV